MSALSKILRAAALMLATAMPVGASATLITLQESYGVSGSVTTFNVNGVTLTLNGGAMGFIGGNAVYESQSVNGGSNPITLSFNTAVNNLLVDVYNRYSDQYFQLESLSTAQGVPVNITTSQTRSPGLIENAITDVSLFYAPVLDANNLLIVDPTVTSWNFAIDNIRFDIALSCPEDCSEVAMVSLPGSLPLTLAALFALACVRAPRRTERMLEA
jgi:hypothetical protein